MSKPSGRANIMRPCSGSGRRFTSDCEQGEGDQPELGVTQLHEVAALFGWRTALTPERVGGFIVPAAAAEKHQCHEPAPDKKGEEGAEPKGDPAMLTHFDAAIGILPT